MANETLYALFQTVTDAERAIGALIDHGVPSQNVGVVARRPAEQAEEGRVRSAYTRSPVIDDRMAGDPIVTYEPAPGAAPPAPIESTITPRDTADTPENVDTVGKEGITTTTPQDAAAGAAVGTSVGLVAGILAAAAALVVPGVGIVMAGGALASAIGAAVATTAAGAAVGGVAGYLRDMGMPEQAAEQYADRVHEGDYLISVTVDTAQRDDIQRLLLKYNAAGVDMDTRAIEQPLRPAEAPIVEPVRSVETPAADPVLLTGTPVAEEPLLTQSTADHPILLSGPTVVTPELSAQELDQDEHVEVR